MSRGRCSVILRGSPRADGRNEPRRTQPIGPPTAGCPSGVRLVLRPRYPSASGYAGVSRPGSSASDYWPSFPWHRASWARPSVDLHVTSAAIVLGPLFLLALLLRDRSEWLVIAAVVAAVPELRWLPALISSRGRPTEQRWAVLARVLGTAVSALLAAALASSSHRAAAVVVAVSARTAVIVMDGFGTTFLQSVSRSAAAYALGALAAGLTNVLVPLILVLIVPMARDPWILAAELDAPRTIALLALGALAAVILTFVASRDETRKLATVDPPPERPHDEDLAAVWDALVQHAVPMTTRRLTQRERRDVLVNMWTFALMRVVVLFVAVLAALLVFMGLLVDKATLADWTGGATHTVLGGHVYVVELRLALVLAGIAALSFAAASLAEGSARRRFMREERVRLASALKVAWLYTTASAARTWERPQPGWEWSDQNAFEAEDGRRLVPSLSLTLPAARPLGELQGYETELHWFGDAHELVRVNGFGRVEFLAGTGDEGAVSRWLKRWESARVDADTLVEIRAAARALHDISPASESLKTSAGS